MENTETSAAPTENSAAPGVKKPRGRPPAAGSAGLVKVMLTLDEADAEWAKRQPGGLSLMVRQMLREMRQVEDKQ